MEKEIKIPIGDKKYIYGNLHGSLKNPLIIMVHGLGGFKDEHIHYNGAKFFERNGLSVYRFNLYGAQKDARKLYNCTLAIHAQDLNFVVDYFRKKNVNTIYAIGHSYGGPTILLSKNNNFDKIILWDPSTGFSDIKNEIKKVSSTNVRYLDWGLAVIIGGKMIKEDRLIKPFELVKEINVPIKFIFAGKSDLSKVDQDNYFNAANSPKEKIIIQNASHNFHEESTEQKLFEETLNWLKK